MSVNVNIIKPPFPIGRPVLVHPALLYTKHFITDKCCFSLVGFGLFLAYSFVA
ncbi:hypothetical protein I656_04074 [Geobacillus sp. WSUCF1]|nr:hypothetical protein I656_04074 [Geobacillus sp. WSUCF1]